MNATINAKCHCRPLDGMSARLLTSQADSLRDLSVALGDLQQANPGEDLEMADHPADSVSVTLQGRECIRFTRAADGQVRSLELHTDTATPTRFEFGEGNWPSLTAVTVGSAVYDVRSPQYPPTDAYGRIPLEPGLAELLKDNGAVTRDLALALDNTGADKARGIGWVDVSKCEKGAYPLCFQYDRDGKVADLQTNVGDYNSVDYSYFQGELNGIAQRNPSYVTIDNNIFDYQNGPPTARRYAAWVQQQPV